MAVDEPIYCGGCGKLVASNKVGVYACNCGWVGWTAERLSTMTDRRRSSDIKLYRKYSPYGKDGMMKVNDKAVVEQRAVVRRSRRGETGNKIMDFVRSDKDNTRWSPKVISKVLGLGYANVYGRIQKFLDSGDLVRDPDRRGWFMLADTDESRIVNTVGEEHLVVVERPLSNDDKFIKSSDGQEMFLDIENTFFVGLICKDVDMGYRFDMVVSNVYVPVESRNRLDLDKMRGMIIDRMKERFRICNKN